MEKIAIFPSFKATLNANNVFKKKPEIEYVSYARMRVSTAYLLIAI